MKTFSLAGISTISPLLNTPMPLAWQPEDMIKLSQQPLGILCTKSVTVKPRQGNLNSKNKPEDREYYTPECSLNAVGLANDGLEKHLEYLKQIKAQVNQPIIFHVSGFSIDDYHQLCQKADQNSHPTFIELNLSCPNVDQEVFSEHPELIKQILQTVQPVIKTKKLGLKVAPSADPHLIDQIVHIAKEYSVDYIVTANTTGQSYIYKPDGSPALDVNGGYGGLAGRAVKSINISTLKHYKQSITNQNAPIDLVGVGGVSNGQGRRRLPPSRSQYGRDC